jgi:hypothetical protein
MMKAASSSYFWDEGWKCAPHVFCRWVKMLSRAMADSSLQSSCTETNDPAQTIARVLMVAGLGNAPKKVLQ